jgi:hypothetical protein
MAKASQPPSTPAPDPAETARQLYFAGQASSTTAQGGGSSGGGAVRKKAGPGSPGIAGGVIGRSPAPAAPRTSGAAANLKTIVPAPQPGFAMRYRLLRKSGTGEFVPVAPDTRFRVGEEVVIAIDKNSGGLAMIRRMAALDSTPIPMAIQTNQLARSVPLTVTGPMELVIVLVPQTNTTVPIGVVEPAPAQKSESADDMVYIAEPASASVQPLVVRIAIRVEQ